MKKLLSWFVSWFNSLFEVKELTETEVQAHLDYRCSSGRHAWTRWSDPEPGWARWGDQRRRIEVQTRRCWNCNEAGIREVQ